ncbi:MAG: MFS transporter [Thaumarchaeota archaeon]|nr:MFS transporter [Nitrososphaerota archaeon]
MKLSIWMLTLGTFAAGTDILVIAGILPVIANELSVSVAATGLLVTVFTITYAIASPILAIISSTVNRRFLLISALSLFTIGNAFSALAPNYNLLMLARIVTAVGASAFTPTAYATASLLVSEESRGKALAVVVSGFTVSSVIGVPIGSFVGEVFGWRTTFWLVMGLGLISLIALIAIFPSISGSKYVGFRARLSPILKPRIGLSLAIAGIWGVSSFSFYTFLAPLVTHYSNLSGTAVSAILLIVGIGSVAGNVFGGYGSDRFGSLQTGTLSLILRTPLLVAIPLVSLSVIGVSGAMFLFGLLTWMFFVPQQSRILSFASQASSIILSLNNSFVYAGGAIGSAVGGLVLSGFSFSGLVIASLAFNVIALVLQLISAKVSPPPHRVEHSLSKTEESKTSTPL